VPAFSDVAGTRGIRFRQGLGGKRPLTILEATGSGCAFLDTDNDGWLDLFLAGQPRCALYHNNLDGSFTEVTQAAGVGREGFWIGCGTGDYDNDGFVDLFVTGYHTCALYHNNGHGGFTDATAKAGIHDRGYQTSCGFADLDRDGFLDLYICHYVRFGPHEPQYCPLAGTRLQRTCGPDAYLPEVGVFYHNRGNGTFVEATKQFGLDSAHGKAWGAAFADYDGDGWPDLYVANDEMPGDLFHNTGRGRMENVGAVSGTAYGADGALQGGMGADFGDYDNDGRMDLVVSTFWMEPDALYHNEGRGLFSEISYATGLAQATLKRVGFGTKLFDADNDGWLDLYFLNGHVQDTHWVNPEQGMPETMQLFLNQRNGRFRDVSAGAGEPFQRPVVGRGAAFGDFDNDGCVDIAAMDMEGAAMLLRNNGAADPTHRGHWLTVRALTTPGPRDAIGARVTVTARGMKQVREVQTSGSVLSASDPRVHFGLGSANRVDRLSIRWPDGNIETLTGLAVDRCVTVRQGTSAPAVRG
jgi:enediyne biosynthesis protein E4